MLKITLLPQRKGPTKDHYRIDGLTPMQLQMIIHYLKEAPADQDAWKLSENLITTRYNTNV